MTVYPSIAAVPIGTTYYAEVWLRDSATLRGLAGGNLDLMYPTGKVDATTIAHGSVFDVLTSGTIDSVAGLVDNLGGGTFDPVKAPRTGSAWER